MSAIGTKRTFLVAPHMSAFGGKADIGMIVLLKKQMALMIGATEEEAQSTEALGDL